MKSLVIIGAGGLGVEALWAAQERGGWDQICFADDNPAKGDNFHGIPIVGGVEATCDSADPVWFHCAIGNNNARGRVFEQFVAKGWQPATLVHPSVIVGPGAEIGEGTYVGAGSILCPYSTVGRGVVINCHVTVGHDARMDEFSQACPGTRISGNCQVGPYAFLGSNATLRPGVKIGPGATVAANSLAIRNVSAGMVIGVPARGA